MIGNIFHNIFKVKRLPLSRGQAVHAIQLQSRLMRASYCTSRMSSLQLRNAIPFNASLDSKLCRRQNHLSAAPHTNPRRFVSLIVLMVFFSVGLTAGSIRPPPPRPYFACAWGVCFYRPLPSTHPPFNCEQFETSECVPNRRAFRPIKQTLLRPIGFLPSAQEFSRGRQEDTKRVTKSE